MKAGKIFWLIFLSIALLPGPAQLAYGQNLLLGGAGGSGLLGRPSQICELNLDNATGNWVQVLPDGATQTFNWGNGKYFVMTGVCTRFYANTVNTHPYRLFFKAPNGTILWLDNLENLTYPTTGSTVWGGGIIEALSPGIVMSVKPTIEVRQLPVPPNNPNTGPVIPGSVYLTITGYIVP